jgi:hypothetical protein
MTEGDLILEFNGLTTHLILRYAQNDKGGLGHGSSTASLLTFLRSFTAFRMTGWGFGAG